MSADADAGDGGDAEDGNDDPGTDDGTGAAAEGSGGDVTDPADATPSPPDARLVVLRQAASLGTLFGVGVYLLGLVLARPSLRLAGVVVAGAATAVSGGINVFRPAVAHYAGAAGDDGGVEAPDDDDLQAARLAGGVYLLAAAAVAVVAWVSFGP